MEYMASGVALHAFPHIAKSNVKRKSDYSNGNRKTLFAKAFEIYVYWVFMCGLQC